MRIAIDTRDALQLNPTGKGVWTRHLLDALRKKASDSLMIECFPSTSNPSRKTNDVNCQLSTVNCFSWHWKTARQILTRKPDLFLAPTSFIIPWLLGKKIPTAIVLHDLIAFDAEPHDRKAKLIERLFLPRVLRTVRFIFTVSEATKQDLLTRFPNTDPQKVTVIGAGPTLISHIQKKELSSINYQLSIPQQYILSIGTLCPRKNQLRLIQAFNQLPDDLRKRTRLILAGGRGWQDAEIIRLAEKSQNVEWLGYVDDIKLVDLLCNATLLAYPSLKEGFGFPVLDAMTLGIPVLTSSRSSMQEIAGDAALLVDPTSVESIRTGLESLLMDDTLRTTLQSKGKERAAAFSWEKTVERILSQCHDHLIR